jgi:predicted ATPase
MEFYTPDPEVMRNELDTTGSADILDADGENIASVLDRLSQTQGATKARIDQYLRAIVPGFAGVEAEEVKSYKLLNFYFAVAGSPKPHAFLASGMSDGTLRALALLVALCHLTYARGGAPRWLAEARHRLGPPENSALKQ